MDRFYYFWEKLPILKIKIFILLVFILPGILHGQDVTNKQFYFNSVNFRVNGGAILPHDDTLKPLKKGNIHELEVNVTLNTTGSKEWHKLYGHPSVGISAKYINLSNHSALGHTVGVFPFIAFYPIQKNHFYANIQLGIGIAYVTRKYSATDNPENVAISSPVNFMGDIHVGIGYKLSENIDLTAGVNATHLSNGAAKKPNYGLNMGSLGVGVNYKFNAARSTVGVKYTPKNLTSYKLISVSAAVKEAGDAGGPRYYPLTVQAAYLKPLEKYIDIGASLDVIYDKSARYDIRKKNKTYRSPNDDFSVGTAARFQLPLDKLSAFGEVGIYLYKPNPRSKLMYQRIGLNYRLAKNLSAVVALKTHLNVADHVDWGMAIVI